MFTARTLKPGLSEEDCPITTFYENKRFPIVFLHTDQITLRGQVSLNGFKVFNGFIVEYLNVIGLFAKKLDNLLFSENVVIGQSSFFQVSRFECSHCVTKLCSEQFSVCQTLFTVCRKQVKKAHSVD